jgi:hypothetical protein
MSDPNAFDRVSPAESAGWTASWETEDNFWHENFSSRPYAIGPDYYDRFRPGYRYGFESAQHHLGRGWDEAEPDLQRGWETYEHRGHAPSAWDEIRDAVRDAWDRVVGQRSAGRERRDSEIQE